MSAGKWKKYWGRPDHRERSQLQGREHLGLLEKKRDYKQRAQNFHSQQDALQTLKKKAAFKNPDEFYFKMQTTEQTEDGFRRDKDPEDEDEEQTMAEKLKLDAHDIRYLTMRKKMEDEKIDELKGHLHMARDISEEEMKAKHTIFVDTEEDAAALNEAEFFDTAPEYLTRTYNRPTKAMLESGKLVVNKEVPSSKELRKLERKRSLAYGELAARIKRSKQIEETLDNLKLKRNMEVCTAIKPTNRQRAPDH